MSNKSVQKKKIYIFKYIFILASILRTLKVIEFNTRRILREQPISFLKIHIENAPSIHFLEKLLTGKQYFNNLLKYEKIENITLKTMIDESCIIKKCVHIYLI